MRVAASLAIGLVFVATACGGPTGATPGGSEASSDNAGACATAVASADALYRKALDVAAACDPQSTAVQCDDAARDVCGCPILSSVDPARRAALTSAEADLRATFGGPACASQGMACPQGCAGFPGGPGVASPDSGVPKPGCLPSAVCGYAY